ncbi:centromere protein H [Argonauta hians]
MAESPDIPVLSEKDLQMFSDPDLEKLLTIKSSLQNQLRDEHLSKKAESVVVDPDSESNVSELIKKITLKACKESQRKLTIERLQIGHTLIENLFEKNENTDPKVSKELEYLLEKQRKLSVDILKKHKTLIKLQTELDEIKVENLRTMTQNRELMISLESTNKNLQNVAEKYNTKSKETDLMKELTQLKKENQAFQYILQNLITGSGVNWAADPELLATTLRAGKNL